VVRFFAYDPAAAFAALSAERDAAAPSAR
jgi:hypothetical protein